MDKEYKERVLAKLRGTAHFHSGFYPTPIEELPRLRKALGSHCPRIFIKRDDYTGVGMGGNKVRKLEYVLAQPCNASEKTVITIGGEKSNHARVTAAMCAKLGFRCILVLSPAAIKHQGLAPASLHLDELYGAEIYHVANRQERTMKMHSLAEQLRSEGIEVLEVPLGASTPLGALGYIQAMQETVTQLQAINAELQEVANSPWLLEETANYLKSQSLNMTYIFHASSSGGTQAGLVAGAQIFGLEETRIIGVSPDDPSNSIAAEIKQIIHGINDLLELPPNTLNENVTVLDEYVGEGYGIPSSESEAALQLLARTEGILLDPVYTAKAMAALLDWIQQGRLNEKDNVLFWHTGGQLALFYTPTSTN
jgi:1-aminocyclopropane-1-carboxylate deaminase/D-cysteine desulfhydrase-like pyridoxal-dependent ACC family enzyme